MILDRGAQYWWSFGDGGYDVVELKPGVSPDDLDVVETGPDDIVLKIRGTNDQLTLSGQVSDTGRRVEEVRFADGTVWTVADLSTRSLVPTSGDDVRYAGATAATLEGGAGNDTLYGSPEGDVLDGGSGDDLLAGNGGDDLYRFGAGDGADVILDRGAQYWWGFGDGGYDAVAIRAGIGPEDLDVVETGPDDIVLKVRGTNDRLTLSGQISDSARRIEEVRFANGTTWTSADILSRAIAPTPGNDVHYAGYAPSTLAGGAGDDALHGSGGDDVLDGGTGDDLLDGGWGGNDVYRFGRDDGADTIVDRGPQYWWGFGDGGYDAVELRSGVAPSDIRVLRLGDDLALEIRGSSDRLTMTRALVNTAYRIEEVRFADGTIWTYNDLIARSALGGGSSDHGTLSLPELNPANVELSRDHGRGGTALLVTDTTSGQTVRVENEFVPIGVPPVEHIVFGDGTVWDFARIQQEAWLRGTSSGEQLFSGDAPDTFAGRQGDDYLEGNAGGDEYRYASGDGNDEIADLANATDVDTLKLTNLNAANVELTRDHGRGGLTLWVTDKTTGQSIRIDNEFAAEGTWGVERIVFADGTTWDKARIRQEAWLRGTSSGEQLFSGDAPDTFAGGQGDDYLEGNAGGDEYRYASGDGNDEIADLANATDIDKLRLTDLNANDVQLRRDHGRGGITMWVTDKATGQSIRVDNEFAEDQIWGVEQIIFADGTIWDKARIRQEAWLRGTGGSEALFSGGAADVFVGGQGDDYLEGNAGGDDYRYASGDGNDEIADLANATDIDVLRLENLGSAQVQLRRIGDDLFIRDLTTGQEIRVDHQFASDGNWGIEQIVTGDGTTLDRSAIAAAAWVRGGVGDDYLDVGNSDATYVGGHGNDVLHGHEGADTYVYAAGDGNDFLYDESNSPTSIDKLKLIDLNSTDVTFYIDRSQGDDMFIKVNATGETIKLARQLGDQEVDRLGWGIDKVQFADGTIWNRQQMHAAAWFRGGAGDQNLDGYGTLDNIFDGGTGNDVTHGHDGSDVYMYAKGDGSDLLYDESGSQTSGDTLTFKDLNIPDLTFYTDFSQGADAFINVNGTSDTIKLAAQFVNGGVANGFGIDRLQFADGTVWDRARLMNEFGAQHASVIVREDDDLSATAVSDVFEVHAGFGSASIDGFDTTSAVPDVLQLDRSAFSDWAHLLGATRQVGSDLVIDVSPNDRLLLKNVSLSAFHQESIRLM